MGTHRAPPGPPPERDIPLDVPKKTKLYVEQTTREKENAIDMHRIFQLHCYHVKGKKNSSMTMPHPISCMTVLSTSRSTVSKALIVCLNNGEVRLYNGKYLVHT